MVAAGAVLVVANVLGDLWDWAADVLGRISDISIYWLLLALALKATESALIEVTWRNILRASYPRSGLSFKTSWGASQGGTAINAVTPAQAGTAAMIGIFRTRIPGSTVAGVTSATVVRSLFFTGLSVLIVIAVAIFRPRTVSQGSPSDESGGFVAEHPILVTVGAVIAIVLLVALWRRLKPRLVTFWDKAKAGGAILRDWKRYTLQTQALDVASLRGHASTPRHRRLLDHSGRGLTIWNVALRIIVMLWAFGFETMNELLSSGRKAEAPASDPSYS